LGEIPDSRNENQQINDQSASIEGFPPN